MRQLASLFIIVLILVGCGGGSSAASTPEVLTPPELEPPPTDEPLDTDEPTHTPEPVASPDATETQAPVPTETPTVADEVDIDSGPFERVTTFDFADAEDLFTASIGPGPDKDSLWIVAGSSAALYTAEEAVIDSVDEDERIVGVDDLGRLWFSAKDGTELGYAGELGRIVRFDESDGWEPVSGISTYLDVPRVDSRGWTWIGTPVDLRVLRDDDQWEIVTPPDMPIDQGGDPDAVVSSFSIAMIGAQVWVGHCYFAPPGPVMDSEGLRFFDGESWNTTPITDGCSRDVRQDGAGNIWAGDRDSLWRLDAATGEWSNQALPEVTEASFVYLEEFLMGPNGDLWPVVVLCGGASCYGAVNLYHAYSDGALAQVGESDFSGMNRWRSFVLADGRGLLLWGGGLHLIDRDGLIQLVEASIVDAYQDESGQVWALAWVANSLELWRLTTP